MNKWSALGLLSCLGFGSLAHAHSTSLTRPMATARVAPQPVSADGREGSRRPKTKPIHRLGGLIPACTAPQLVRADQGIGAFQDVPAAGGTFTMLVWPAGGDCSWGVTENADILVNLAPTSGEKAGPTNYTVLANTGPARTAVITSGGSTFEIRQAAGSATTPPPAPTPSPFSNDPSVLGAPGTCAKIAMTTVKSGATLKQGTFVFSPSRQYKLIYQTDGNLVLYRASGEFLWNNSKLNVGGRLSMQTDGNLVSYDSAGKAIWATNTSGKVGAALGVQDDGNVVIYKKGTCTAIWSIR